MESARLEAQVLAAHVLARDRAWVLAHPSFLIGAVDFEPFLARRESREPLAYILGYREFFGRRFAVTPDILIPRQETETLVEAALALMPPESSMRILDLGTGSGCVGITLALERPRAEVWASDLSAAAIEVARANAETLGASLRLVESDLFSGLRGEVFDLIVSNPPYVESGAALAPEIRDWEPASALFAGADGMEAYRQIAAQAGAHLVSEGHVALEVGDGQSELVRQVFLEEGWNHISTRNDLSGFARVIVLNLAT